MKIPDFSSAIAIDKACKRWYNASIRMEYDLNYRRIAEWQISIDPPIS